MDKLTIKDVDLKNKKVIMRVDFNIPIKDGKIIDDTRIKAALSSIKYVLEKNGSLILMSHLGKPKGKDQKYTLSPCAERLSYLLNKKVVMAKDCVGPEVMRLVNELKSGEIILLENLRFYEAEEHPEKDPNFAKTLASYADIYVNDAFGTAHRAHSSTVTIAQYFPKKAVAGFLMEKEINFLSMLLHNPKRPYCAIIGGAKISSKLGVVEKLVNKVDMLFIGGGMVFTLLKAKGQAIGKSIVEEDQITNAKTLLANGKDKLFLPLDIVIADDNNSNVKTIDINEDIPNNFKGVDVGPKSIAFWGKYLKSAKTIFWNGPLGIYEEKAFAVGTNELAKLLSEVPSATTVVGGGDSLAAISGLHLDNKFSHLSTGGGASLEYLEFGKLPGVEALSYK
jgi:phosphoglycerate kinase